MREGNKQSQAYAQTCTKPLLVLLVEDTENNIQVTGDYLRTKGYRVYIARNGIQAIERVKADPPDVILMDVQIPQMDGLEAIHRLRAIGGPTRVMIIALTALAMSGDRERCLDAGVDAYLSKPVRMTRLIELIDRLIADNTSKEVKTGPGHTTKCPAGIPEQVTQGEAISDLAAENAAWSAQAAEPRIEQGQAAAQLLHVHEAERKRLSHALHHDLGQVLTEILLDLSEMEQTLAPGIDRAARKKLQETKLLADQALAQLYDLSFALRPSLLDDLGLVPALRWHVERFARRLGIQAELVTNGLTGRLDADIETALYRIVQEALTNVSKHTQASQVWVHLERVGATITVRIWDNDQGLDRPGRDPAKEVGLWSIQERIASLGGTMRIISAPGRGTELRVETPVN